MFRKWKEQGLVMIGNDGGRGGGIDKGEGIVNNDA